MSCPTCATETGQSCNCLPCQEVRAFNLCDCTDRGGTQPQPFPVPCTPPSVSISNDQAVLSYIDGEPVWIVDSQ